MKNRFIRARRAAPWLGLVALLAQPNTWANELNPVVISASRSAQPLSDVLPAVSVISRQDIDQSQAPSLADLLQGEAGVEFGRNGGPGNTTSFFLRGQNSINVVLLIDGVRAQVDGIGALQITDMPLAQIDRIEIMRGNASALYGDAAIGGVIQIFTRKGQGDAKAYGALTRGAHQSYDIHAGLGGAMDGLSYNVQAGQKDSDGFSAMNASMNKRVNPDKDGYGSQFIAAKLDQKLAGDLNVGMRVQANRSNASYDSGSSFGGDLASDVHRLKSHHDQATVYARKVIHEQWVSTLDLSHSSLGYENFKNDGLLSNGTLSGTQDGVHWFNTWQARPQSLISFGADQSTARYSASGPYGYTLRREGLGYFAGLTETIERLTVQLNVRRDQIQMDRVDALGSASSDVSVNSSLLGLGYALTPAWRLTATGSVGFRAPTAYEISTNAAVKPENYTSKEIGLTYKATDLLARVVYFASRSQDAIDFDAAFQAVNIGETANQGLEATVRADWWGNRVKLSYVDQNPRNVVADQVQARRAKSYGSLDVSRTLAGYEVGTKIHAAGMRKDSAYSTHQLAGYATLALYVSRKINDQWTARLRLENALDKQYQLAYGYNSPGRGLLATLQYSPK